MHGTEETLRRIWASGKAENGWQPGQKTVPTGTAETLGDGPVDLVMVFHDDGAETNGNTAVVWVADVSLSISPASGGAIMRPGDVLIFPVTDLSDLYVISPTAAQVLNFLAIRTNDA